MSTSTLSFLSGRPSVEEIDVKIDSLNREITRIQADIRRINEHKNTHLLSISRLPLDVLSDILEALARAPAPQSPTFTPEAGAYAHRDLLPATQVCRRWRHLALHSPRIWGCISACAPLRVVELFLERSGAAPLYLCGSSADGLRDGCVHAALGHLYHVQEITLKTEGRAADAWVARIAAEPTPQLELLSLEDATPSASKVFQFAAAGDAFPALRHLSLSGYTFKASTLGSLTNLRTLTISSKRAAYHGTQRITPQHTDPVAFFALLNGLPLLSSLNLTNTLAEQTRPAPPLAVSLPNLAHLSIEDPDISNLALTARITAPRLKTVKLLHSGKASAAGAAPAIAAIYASRAPFPPGARAEFELYSWTYSFARVRVWAGCPSGSGLTSGSGSGSGSGGRAAEPAPPLFDLQVHGTGDFGAEGLVFTLCPPTDVPPAFHYYSEDGYTARDPLAAFRRTVLGDLRRTTDAHFDYTIDLLYALGGDAPDPRAPYADHRDARADDGDDDSILALPALERIVLWGDMPILPRDATLARLKHRLRARKAAGAPVRTWVVAPGVLTREEIAGFEGIVDVVESPEVAVSRRYC
ncbi:hypothetical protein EYR40_001543 [Pleurotus pulmonarius]|nr:hypothetical protein EYR36_000103 [Pleurotus pulmonarius]KAF4604364.1 hypothetical protein EYR38_004786 [Pleurotus pulmonarius]KAF4609190.1 hypothetical protein EYR40_001543 [Pleurotus pulmonarius]